MRWESVGWQPEPAAGTYLIDADCSLTMTVHAPPPLSILVTFKGSITGDGLHLSFAEYDPARNHRQGAERRSDSVLRAGWQDVTGDWFVENARHDHAPIRFRGRRRWRAEHLTFSTFGDYSMGTLRHRRDCTVSVRYSARMETMLGVFVTAPLELVGHSEGGRNQPGPALPAATRIRAAPVALDALQGSRSNLGSHRGHAVPCSGLISQFGRAESDHRRPRP